MVSEVREMLDKLLKGAEDLREADSGRMDAFNAFVEAAEKTGALDLKTKELIILAISLYSRCDNCIVHHTQAAFKAGASRQEVIESAFLACFMGGGPTVASTATVLLDAIAAFAPGYGR